MRFYHFTNAENGLDDLEQKHLKIARIKDLNDPFEVMGVDLSNPENRRVLEELKAHYNEEIGLLCFSKNWDNPVQWAHYADKHKGLCLGFDVADDFLAEVTYEDERLPADNCFAEMVAFGDKLRAEIDANVGPSSTREEVQARREQLIQTVVCEENESGNKGLQFMENILIIKFSHWRYEQEYRRFEDLSPTSQTKKIGTFYYVDFSDELVLREVIIGINSQVTKNQINGAIGASPEIAVLKARLHDSRFAIEKSLV